MTPLLFLGLIACAHVQHDDSNRLAFQLNSEVLALRVRLQECQARSGTCLEGDAPAPVFAELTQVLRGTDVKVTRKGSTTELTIPNTLLFANTMRVREESGMVMDLISTALNLHPEYGIVVEGHTDDAPVPSSLQRAYPTNWEYGSARAAAVARKLVSEYKVDPARITIASRAHMDAVAENDTPEGRASNRRIVIRLTQIRSVAEEPPPRPDTIPEGEP